MAIDVVLELTAATCGDQRAIGGHGDEDTLTFGAVQQRAQAAAALLRAQGGRTLAYLGVNGPAFHVAVFAASMAGIPLCPLNYRLSASELAELLARLDRPVVLADDDLLALVPPGAAAISTIALLHAAPASPPFTPPEAVDPTAVVLFTSGTTSTPKAVLVGHEHLTAYVLQTVELLAAQPQECALVAVPTYHVAGVATVLSNTYAGRRVVHLPQFSPQGWLTLVRAQGVTSAMVVPTMLARLVEHLAGTPADVPTLRSLAYGGARVSPIVLRRALDAFPDTGFVNAYGLTETSSTICVLGPEDHRAAHAGTDAAATSRLASAGRPVPGIELQIRDPAGTDLAAGQRGELYVRGPQVSGSYAGVGSVLDADGWFPTRDRAWLDADGYLFIEGRADDTIIRGGENVAPAEVEDVLLAHPDVRDAAVIGVPDEEWGQRIGAAVVVHDAALAVGAPAVVADLHAFARERLRSAKAPDVIEVWRELPYSPTGKLLRREVSAAFGTPADQPIARTGGSA